VLSAQRGAAALVLLTAMGAVLTGGAGVVDVAAAMSAQAHAESAADAVAHGVAVALLGDADREKLSIAVQAGSPCDTDEKDLSAAGPACGRAVAAARAMAAANRAVLRRLLVGPDPRDMREGRGAGRVLVEAHVFVARGVPIHPGSCPAQPGSGSDLCWAEAWSAAQGAG
jgi:hypothetical protein